MSLKGFSRKSKVARIELTSASILSLSLMLQLIQKQTVYNYISTKKSVSLLLRRKVFITLNTLKSSPYIVMHWYSYYVSQMKIPQMYQILLQFSK